MSTREARFREEEGLIGTVITFLDIAVRKMTKSRLVAMDGQPE